MNTQRISVRQPLHFAVSDWFLVEHFSKLVQQSIEHGFMQHFAKRTQQIIKGFKEEVVRNPTSNQFQSITLDKLNFVFVIYMCGNLGAVLIFVGELWMKKLKNRERMPFIH